MKESYYLERIATTCDADWKEYLKIGTFTEGLCFRLIVYPSLDIYTLEDWKDVLYNKNYKIISKDGTYLEPDEMLELITQPHASNLKRADINLSWVLGYGGNFDWVRYEPPLNTWSHKCPIKSNRGCC